MGNMKQEIIDRIEKEIQKRERYLSYGLVRAKAIVYFTQEKTWIPVSERIPEEGTRVLTTIKHHKWITDYEEDWLPECEKTVNEEYMEVCEAIYFGEIGWEYRCMDTNTAVMVNYAFVNPEIDISSQVDEVVAWMPLPEPYRPN